MINISQQQILMAQALVGAATLALPPGAQSVAAVVLAGFGSLAAWIESGSADVTDEALEALFAQYAKNKADDLKAQAELLAKMTPAVEPNAANG